MPLSFCMYFLRTPFAFRCWLKNSIYSICHYHSFMFQYRNHFTIGIKKLASAKTVFPHPIGIVIGEGVNIGYNCTIYQNVTIGLKSSSDKNYPRIGNNVKVYANSIIIGDIEIGDNCIIGASTVVTQSIPPNSVVAGIPGKIVKHI